MEANTIFFSQGSVPVKVAAKIYGRDCCWVRAGMIAGWLPIGFATRRGELVTDISEMNSKKGRINYYISPQKLYEQTGFKWEGKNGYVNTSRDEL